jgi:hypothetical protein
VNEGPIALNEHGIAGRCKQSIRAFRASLKELLDDEKLALVNGRLVGRTPSRPTSRRLLGDIRLPL